MNPSLTLDLGDGRHSQLYIGSELLDDASVYGKLNLGSKVAIVSNRTVADLYAQSVIDNLSTEHELVLIGDGESYKSIETYWGVIDRLIKGSFNRDASIIALGGGVVGDLAGFVAATYQRGIQAIQIPTTLLAQVDAAVGGKTAINHPAGKNLVGAFYQPEVVIIDTSTLDTLPDRVFVEGLAEVIKYGAIYDAEFFSWLEDNAKHVLARAPAAMNFIVKRSCKIKAEVVAQDEREADLRAILNFGHTFGHALEVQSNYGQLLHGEAVAIGMILAADLALRIGLCDQRTVHRLSNIVKAYYLPNKPPPFDTEALLKSMSLDKKVISGQMRFILPLEIGKVVVTSDVKTEDLRATLSNQTEL